MNIKGEEILFLLGAGASMDAGIPMANTMVTDIESLILTDNDWMKYRDLYNYLKSSINYSDGIVGKFDEPFNVERLLIVMGEIEKRESNIMYPFIGTWNIRLLDLAGPHFENIKQFKQLIHRNLNDWVGLQSYKDASYYEGFSTLSSEIGSLINVFTLNYDLCFEKIVSKNKKIQLGFTEETLHWDQSNFDITDGIHFNLYKLHGSLDWYTRDGKLCKSEKLESNPQVIFGKQNKMTSLDPYFYYTSRFRNCCFQDAKVIIIIGYSYSDEYINIILSQALKSRTEFQLVDISPSNDVNRKKGYIKNRLNLENINQINIAAKTAKDFISEEMNKKFLAQFIKEPDNAPF